MYITEETQLYLDDTEATAFFLYSGESIDLSQFQIDVHPVELRRKVGSEINSLETPAATFNFVVWNNLKTGMNSTKPVAVLAGNQLPSESNVYPDSGNIPSIKFLSRNPFILTCKQNSFKTVFMV